MCVSPITLRVNNINGVRSILVPCGRCFECLRHKQNDWMIRMLEEFKNYSVVSFVTLTYNEDSVPFYVDTNTGECFRTVCKSHIQNALKRFRKNTGFTSDNFKYFICSEYGPRTKRPHYHCLFYGLSVEQLLPFITDWQNRFGYVCAKPVKFSSDDSFKTARYVSKYCSKGVFENPLVSLGCVDKSFRLVSKHLGESYVFRMKDFHLGHGFHFLPSDYKKQKNEKLFTEHYLQYVTDNMFYTVPNSSLRYRLPRYFKVKIYGEKNFLSAAITRFLSKKYDGLRRDKLRELQSMHPDWSNFETDYYLVLSEREQENEKNELSRKALSQFFDCSIL